MLRLYVLIALILASSSVSAAQQKDLELAYRLANPGTRKAAVATLQNSGVEKLPLLLSWTQRPPSTVDKGELYIGLADAFGALKAEKAIPFLINQIGLNEFPYTDVWTKTPEAVLERLPSVRALIQIGPPASRAAMHAFSSYTTANERLAAIFVVSRIEGVAEAQTFLAAVAGQAKVQEIWAEEGLENLAAHAKK